MVSVIVPIYNVERFLPKCIDSLVGQTENDIEIILVDDGSPDRCGEICDRYAAVDSRIKVIHQPNSGVSAARNAGLSAAKGDYIGFCDPDDFVSPQMYGRMLQVMLQSDAEIVICGYDYYDEDSRLDDRRKYQKRDDELLSKEDLYRKLSDMPPTIRHGVVNKLFRKSKIAGLHFDTKLHSAEDGNFLLDYLNGIETGVFIHEPLYKNVVRQGSATHGGLNISRLRDSFRVHNRMYEDTVLLFPLQKDHALAFLLDVCTLKYNEAKERADRGSSVDETLLKDMRSFIRKKALKALRNKSIHWKTKIYYLLLWIRK